MKRRVALVIDNSPVIVRIVSHALEEAGYDVLTAKDGLAGLDSITVTHPDIVFTDLIMPKIDGAKLCKIIRSTPEYADIFLVILSGIALEDTSNVLGLGADFCIAKGPAATMRRHILEALDLFESGNRQTGIVAGLQDIVPREVTSELLVSKRHAEIIFERMTEGTVELDDACRIIRVNPVSCTLFASTESELLGREFFRLLPHDKANVFKKWVDSLQPGTENRPLEFTYDDPVMLNNRPVTFNLVPIFENTRLFILGILHDVAERKLMEAQRHQLEKEQQRIRKLEAMSTMASGIAHDFNNLLTIINGNVEMALLQCGDAKVQGLLQETSKALQMTNELIYSFTTFSDNYLPSRSPFQIEPLVARTFEEKLVETEVSYSLDVEKNLPKVELDEELFCQALTRIIDNGIEAMQKKGRFEVTISRSAGKELRELAVAAAGGATVGNEMSAIQIRIRDTGPGIKPELLDRVFDPYFSTKEKGTQKGMGLGLTLAHAIIQKHGGALWLESGEHQGCTAVISLPVKEAAAESGTERQKDTPVRLLVMDDDEMMRTIVGRMFEHFQVQVTTASDGEEAVALFQQAKNEGMPYELVVLDLHVDSGLNGIDTARRLHDLDSTVVLVAMSGDPGDPVMQRHSEYHFSLAVAKPFALDTVQEVLNTYARLKTTS